MWERFKPFEKYIQNSFVGFLLVVFGHDIPGVISSAVNGSGPDEAGRLVVEGRPADGTA